MYDPNIVRSYCYTLHIFLHFVIIGYVDVFPTLIYKLCRSRIFIIFFQLLYYLESSEFRLCAQQSMPQMTFKSVCSPAYDCSWSQ